MEKTATSLWLVALLYLSQSVATKVEELNQEATTPSYDFSTYFTTEDVTDSPIDNGMAVVDIPQETTPSGHLTALEGKEVEPVTLEPPSLIAFPENHKNFTPSQYLGDSEFPPYFHPITFYRNEYKNYQEEKNLYSTKPIKFEENSTKSYFVPPGIHFDEEDGREQSGPNLKPFPYTFEKEGVHEYKNNEIHDDKTPNEEVVYGRLKIQQQPAPENPPPYYFFPHEHKSQELHHHHHQHHQGGWDHHHHQSHNEVRLGYKKSPWKKVVKLLTALVPLGLFLASLTPNVISINATTNTKTTRQRSMELPEFKFKEEDVLKLLKENGLESLGDSQCEDKAICELARKGDQPTANSIERGFWYLANQTPTEVAEKAGMTDLFKAIKTGNCNVYVCESKTKSDFKKRFGKKIIRRRKTQKDKNL